MKKLLTASLLLLCLSIVGLAQPPNPPQPWALVPNVASLNRNCLRGDAAYVINATPGANVYLCTTSGSSTTPGVWTQSGTLATPPVGSIQIDAGNNKLGPSTSTGNTCATYQDCPTMSIRSTSAGAGTGDSYIAGNIAAISNGSAGTVALYNVAKPEAPVLISTVTANLAMATTTTDVFIFGKFLYFVAIATDSSWETWDITNPSSPTFVGGIASCNTAFGGGGPFNCGSYLLAGNILYISGAGSGVARLGIFDVTNRAAPITLSITTSAGYSDQISYNRSFILRGNLLFWLVDGLVTSTTEQVEIFNVSNLASPTVVGHADFGTVPSGEYQPVSIQIVGEYLYVAMHPAFSCSTNCVDVVVYNIANPASPAQISTYSTNQGTPGDSYTYDMVISGNTMYLGRDIASMVGACLHTIGECGVEIVSISNPTTPTRVATALVNNGATGVDSIGEYLNGKILSATGYFVTTNWYILEGAGFDIPQGRIGSLYTTNIQVGQDVEAYQGYFQNFVKVGPSGVHSQGPISGHTLELIACTSSASPAVCSNAASGFVAIPAGVNPTLVVNTTAVTAGSVIRVQSDDTLGAALGVTCNSTLATITGGIAVSGRTAGTSFTLAFNGTVVANPLCLSYLIVN